MTRFLSPSKLKRFRNCPHQCKFEPYTENDSVNFGNAVHDGIAAKMKGENFLSAFTAKALELGVSIAKTETAKACIEFVESMNIDPDSILDIECEKDGNKALFGRKFLEMEFCKEWGFLGAIDLVFIDKNGGLVIVDWKTGQTEEEDDLQLSMYALAAFKKYGEFPYYKTIFAYVEKGYCQVVTWEKDQLTGALDYLKGLANQYLEAEKKNVWKQTPHKWCKYCSLQTKCEAFQKQLQAKPDRASYDIDMTIENLPTIIDYHNKVKAIADAAYEIQQRMKDKYEKILIETGPITIGGRTYQIKEKNSRYNYNLPTIFLKTGEMIGRPPVEICEFSSGQAKEFRKALDKDQKKAFDAIIENNREVKTKSKTLDISISKGGIAEIGDLQT